MQETRESEREKKNIRKRRQEEERHVMRDSC